MKPVTKKRIFLEEYLPAIIAGIIGLITYIVLINVNLSFTSPSQIGLFVIVCAFPALFFTISAGKIRFPPAIKIGIYVYVFFSNFLATTFNAYAFVPIFDTILHAIFGFLCNFMLLYLLIFLNCKKNMSFLAVSIILLFMTAGIGMFWEVIEYFTDILTNVNSQHSIEEGLLDTMNDTFSNLAGACLFQIVHCLDHVFFHDNFFTKIDISFSKYLGEDSKPIQLLFVKK